MLSTSRHDPPVVLTEQLERAVLPEDLLATLSAFGLLEEDIARVTSTHARTVRRWKVAAPKSKAAARLAELRVVIVELRLGGAVSDRGIIAWLRHANYLLEGWAPLDVIGAGGFRTAREAALAYIIPTQRVGDVAPTVRDELQAAHARLGLSVLDTDESETKQPHAEGTDQEAGGRQLTAVSDTTQAASAL